MKAEADSGRLAGQKPPRVQSQELGSVAGLGDRHRSQPWPPDLANAIVDAYVNEYVDKEHDSQSARIWRNFRGHPRRAERGPRSRCGPSIGAVGHFTGHHRRRSAFAGTADPLAQAQQVKTELAKTKLERLRATADVAVLEQRRKDMEEGDFKAPADEVEMMVLADPIGRMLMDDIAALEFGTENGQRPDSEFEQREFSDRFGRWPRSPDGSRIWPSQLQRIQENMAMQWRTEQTQGDSAPRFWRRTPW